MTREVTDQLYIDLGYLTPEDYFTYEADAASAITSTASMTVAVGVIKQGDSAMTVTTSVTGTISHIEGADLFALSDALLSAQVDRIRDNNIAVSSQFDVATDVSRIVHFSADETSTAALSVTNGRIRASEAATSAAFALTADVEMVPGGTVYEGEANLSIVASTSIDGNAVRSAISSVSSIVTETISGGIVKQGAADCGALFSPSITCSVTLNSFAVLETNTSVTASLDGTKEYTSNLSSTTSVTARLDGTKEYASNLSSSATVSIDPVAAKVLESSLATAFTQTTAGNTVTVTESTLTSSTSISVTNSRIRYSSSDVTSQTSISIDGNAVRGGIASVSVVASESALVGVVKQFAADCGALFTPSISCNATVNSFAVLETTASLTSRIDGTKEFDSQLSSTSSLSAVVHRTAGLSANVSSEFNLNSTSIRIKSSSSNQSVSVNQTTDANRFRGIISSVSSAFSISDAYGGPFGSGAGLWVLRGFDANLQVQGSVVSIIGSIETNVISISSTFTQTTNGTRVSRSNPYTVYSSTTDSNFGQLSIDSTTKKFGAGSLRFHTLSGNEYPLGKPIYVGTDWYAFNNSYVWKSTDGGDTWTRTSHNGYSASTSWSANKIKYLNGYFVTTTSTGTNTALSYSTDGITWTTSSTSSPYAVILDFDYTGSHWIILAGNYIQNPADTAIYVGRSTSITSPSWSWVWIYNLPTAPGGSQYQYSGANGYFSKSGSTILIATSLYGYDAANSSNRYTRTRIYTSTNLTTWTNRYDSSSTTDYPRILGLDTNSSGSFMVSLNDATKVYTLTSSDTGVNWTQRNLPQNYLTGGDLHYYNSAWYIEAYTDPYTVNTLYKTTDLGVNWTTQSADNKLIRNSATWSSSKISYFDLEKGTLGYTSDFSSYTSKSITNQVLAPRLDYQANTDWNNWRTVDFWFNPPTTGQTVLLSNGNTWSVSWFNSGVLSVSTRDSSYTTRSIQSGVLTKNTWHHIRIVSDGSTFKLFYDGVQTTAATKTGTYGSKSDSITPFSVGPSVYDNYSDWYIDELLITDEQLTPIASTTYTVPTNEYANSALTDGLFHYNVNFEDDNEALPRTQQGIANFVSSSVFSANAGKQVVGASSQFSTANLSASISRTRPAEAALNVSASEVTAIGRIRPFASLEDSQFSLSSAPIKTTSTASNQVFAADLQATVTKNIGPITADLSSTSSLSIDARVTTGITIALDVQGSLLTAVGRIRPFVSLEDTQFSLTADPITVKVASSAQTATAGLSATVTKNIGPITSAVSSTATLTATAVALPAGSAQLQAAFTELVTALRIRKSAVALATQAAVSASAIVVKVASSTQTVTASLTETTLRIRSFSAALQVQGSELAAVAKVGRTLISLSSSFTQTATARTTTGNVVTMDSTSALAVSSSKVNKTFQALLQVQGFTLTDGDVGLFGQGAFSVTSSISVTPRKTAQGATALQTTATLTANAKKVTDVIALESSSGTLTASALRIQKSAVALQASFTAVFNAGKIINGQAALQVQGFVLSTGRVVDLSTAANWTVQRDDREWNIPMESRDWTIEQETREYIIKGL